MARREWSVARNGQFGRLMKSAGSRRSPQEHAGVGAIRQKKTPTENGWGFVIGLAGIESSSETRTEQRFHKIFLTQCSPRCSPANPNLRLDCVGTLKTLVMRRIIAHARLKNDRMRCDTRI